MSDTAFLENISSIYKRMSHAAMRAGRNPEDIKLIAVTKTVSIERVKQAVDAGLRIFGESRVQEAQKKVMSTELKAMSESLSWHLIGHLQKNKAKVAVELFDLIHSVDSAELAEAINKYAEKLGKTQEILVQVKLSSEAAKHGIIKDNLINLLDGIKKMKHLKVKGLMTIPPYFDEPGMARPYFKETRRLRDEAEMDGFKLPELSMGMTNDFEVAIEEGATMVRIGTAIFGDRA
ncbi:MAG: YggS family pyridoxal phosphate-dependent enzyme [Thermodesulfovibrionales bacterium]|nr:YggS family pyridoxal phosphate-dependent enzyme [Thermodesulfovibrionales bacterium]